jgi:ribonuclease P protein component
LPIARPTAAAAGSAALFRYSTFEDLIDEAHVPAQQPCPQASPRLPHPLGHPGRPQGARRPPCARPQVALGLILPKNAEKLRRRPEFLAANAGLRKPMPGFVLLVRRREDGDETPRLGITVTKKIGGAVIRNRMKRRFRALGAELLPAHGIRGADHVIIGRSGGVERDYAQLRDELTNALRKLSTK